jgi:hypothetical protein
MTVNDDGGSSKPGGVTMRACDWELPHAVSE